MKDAILKFQRFLDRPIATWSRVALALLVVPLLFAFTAPLWRISMQAPQYPKGLYLEIYTHRIDGGNEGHDIQEINTLNHYIGMRPIERADLDDLDWMPFALIALGLLTLRCAAIGNVRMLVDLAVTTTLVAGFAMGRFVYKLHVYGHDLDPKAPLDIEPFTPAIFGTKQIANFSTSSYPQLGSALVGTFVVGIGVIALWHLVSGWRAERRAGSQGA